MLLAVIEWAKGLQSFITSDHVSGRRLVGIGHSVGATAMSVSSFTAVYLLLIVCYSILSTAALDSCPFAAIILVEPALITRAAFDQHREERIAALAFLRKAINARRDIWNSRDDAMQFFRNRVPWKLWDSRILALFVVSKSHQHHLVLKAERQLGTWFEEYTCRGRPAQCGESHSDLL